MKRIIAFSAIIASLLTGCGNNYQRGEVVGVKGHAWHPYRPYGMSLIPGGAFVMGKQNEDKEYALNAPTRTVTVRAFYMDETEITNAEYREFVNYVRDSIIRYRLAVLAEEMEATPKKGIGKYMFKSLDTTKNAYNKYMMNTYGSLSNPDDENAGKVLNWEVPLIFNTNKFPDEYYAEVMDSMYLPIEETGDAARMFDVNKFIYKLRWYDNGEAARKGERRSKHIKDTVVKVYPDTTVWVKDFMYAYNEPMHDDYFWHDAYSEYPVVGVNWYQATAFADYRTKKMTWFLKSKNRAPLHKFRLPTEAEWEYAARGGMEGNDYPWGGPYTMNEQGCFLANFKPLRGDYGSDQAVFTAPAKSYNPNGYNLYNMAGNVAEWTNSSYYPDSYYFGASFNPTTDAYDNKRKIIRGGSWKDVKYFIQVHSRAYEYADTARSYIGFRCVEDFMGVNARHMKRKGQN